MDINVRIKMSVCTLIAWSAWLAGATLVLLDSLEIVTEYGTPGMLIAMFGTIIWLRQWFCQLKERELVAFDHGRQVERAAAGLEVIQMDAHR